MGIHTLRINPDIKIHCFEPSKGSFVRLKEKGFGKIIGSEIRYITEQIEIMTLDSYCMEKNVQEIDFLKIDVEGNELAVIEGGKGFI